MVIIFCKATCDNISCKDHESNADKSKAYLLMDMSENCKNKKINKIEV